MKPIEFPQQNTILAKNQPEYTPVPVFAHIVRVPRDPFMHQGEDGTKEICQSMTAVYEFSDEEIAEIIANKKLFYRQYLHGHQFQPIFMSTKDPFIPENAELHWPPL